MAFKSIESSLRQFYSNCCNFAVCSLTNSLVPSTGYCMITSWLLLLTMHEVYTRNFARKMCYMYIQIWTVYWIMLILKVTCLEEDKWFKTVSYIMHIYTVHTSYKNVYNILLAQNYHTIQLQKYSKKHVQVKLLHWNFIKVIAKNRPAFHLIWATLMIGDPRI